MTKPADATRFAVRRTPEGGVSIGYTSLSDYRKCARKFYWNKLHGGHGLEYLGGGGSPNLPMLYGSLWHALYRAEVAGDDAAAKREALVQVLAEKELDSGEFGPLLDEVERDMAWYWGQERQLRLKVLHAEEELCVKVGRHELRGTPDLIAEREDGTVVIPDHKTYGVLSRDQRGNPRITLNPRDEAIVRYQTSRQFAYYMYLWNTLHPDRPCYDALLNMVPSHVTEVIAILSGRKGNVMMPDVKRLSLSYDPAYIYEVGSQALADCDEIAQYLGGIGVDNLDFSLRRFRESPSECSGFRGDRCVFWDLCTEPAMRPALLEGAFKVKNDEEATV